MQDPIALGNVVEDARDRGLDAMVRMLEEWLATELDGRPPVFVGHNAAFDWMFVADCFERHLGRNPFGHSALDIKAHLLSNGMATSSLNGKTVSGKRLNASACTDSGAVTPPTSGGSP